MENSELKCIFCIRNAPRDFTDVISTRGNKISLYSYMSIPLQGKRHGRMYGF